MRCGVIAVALVCTAVLAETVDLLRQQSSTPGYAFHTNPPGGLPKYVRDNVISGAAARF